MTLLNILMSALIVLVIYIAKTIYGVRSVLFNKNNSRENMSLDQRKELSWELFKLKVCLNILMLGSIVTLVIQAQLS